MQGECCSLELCEVCELSWICAEVGVTSPPAVLPQAAKKAGASRIFAGEETGLLILDSRLSFMWPRLAVLNPATARLLVTSMQSLALRLCAVLQHLTPFVLSENSYATPLSLQICLPQRISNSGCYAPVLL